MNLASTISIYGGGVGSGCKGPNCGRPAKKMGNFDKSLLMKQTAQKNMHEMSKMLMEHQFMRSGSVGQYQPGSKSQGAAILGSPGSWMRVGKREALEDPMDSMKSKYQTHRIHNVLTSPAGWVHTSSFGADYKEHGRGLNAGSLDKHLKKHGL